MLIITLEIDEYSKSTPLIQAIKYKQTDIINYLLENNPGMLI